MKNAEYYISELIDFFILTNNLKGLKFFGKLKKDGIEKVTYGALENIFEKSYVNEIAANVNGHISFREIR